MRVELSGLRILVLDDSTRMLALLGTVLLGFGIRDITRVRTSKAALRTLESGLVDLAIIDKHLEDEDGIQFLRTARTRNDNRDPRIPIIVLMAHTAKRDVIEAALAGATDVLTKPVSPRILFDHMVDAVLKPRSLFDCGSHLVPIPRGVPVEQAARMTPGEFLALVRELAERRLRAARVPGALLGSGDDLAHQYATEPYLV